MHYVEDAAESLSRAVGLRVRQERKNRDWTLDQLASAAGVSRRMLVNIEQGGVNPSIGTLLRISDALGVGLPALVEPPASRATRITRQSEGAVLWTGPSGGRAILVAGTESPDVVELWDWTLAPGERHESEAHVAGTRELLQVQDGALTVDIGPHSHELEAGDAMAFHGDAAHSYSNSTPERVRFILTVFEPGVGAGHRTENRNA